MKGIKFDFKNVAMKTVGLGAGVVAGEFIDNNIDKLGISQISTGAGLGIAKILIGTIVPEFLKGKSKSGSINSLLVPFGDGLIASGALTLARETKLITGITGGNDYIMLPEAENYKGGVGAIQKY